MPDQPNPATDCDRQGNIAPRRVHLSDLWKIHDALLVAVDHHQARDRMNGALHLAREVRYSPLTSELSAALDRVKAIIEEAPDA